MSSLKNFGSLLASAIGLGAPVMRGNDASKYIKSSSGAWARTGSTLYIDHNKVLQARKECEAHNTLLPNLREAGILTRAGNVVQGRLADYRAAIASEVKRISLS